MISKRQQDYYNARRRGRSLPSVDRIWRWQGRDSAGRGIVESDRGDVRYGIVSGNAAMAIGRPVLYIPPAPGEAIGQIQLPSVVPGSQIIRTRPDVPLVGEWVYSNLEGTAAVTQNDFTNFVWSYNTRPNSSLFEFTRFNGESDDNYWVRSVDFLFARILTVTTPLRLTVELTTDWLSPLIPSLTYTDFEQVAPDIAVLISVLSDPPPALTAMSDILNSAYAEIPTIFFFAPEVPTESSNPWNRSIIIPGLLNTPIFNIQFNADILSLLGLEGTETATYDFTTPGTYLITGRVGNGRVQLYQPGPGNPATVPPDPEASAVLWAQYDANITIAPPP